MSTKTKTKTAANHAPEHLRILIDGAEREVRRSSYVTAKCRQLHEFGYSSLTEKDTDEQVAAVLAGKKFGKGLTVIGMFMRDEIVPHDLMKPSPFSTLAQCMANTPDDHPEAQEIHEKAARYLASEPEQKIEIGSRVRVNAPGMLHGRTGTVLDSIGHDPRTWAVEYDSSCAGSVWDGVTTDELQLLPPEQLRDAAPDLLAALKDVLSEAVFLLRFAPGGEAGESDAMQRARAAIAKATA